MKNAQFLVALIALGCATPPAPQVQRSGTTVGASFGRSWDAVIDVFSQKNIPIKTIDRASGIIATDQLAVARGTLTEAADCGGAMGLKIPAATATYNVLVRGDSNSSVVKVTPRWLTASGTVHVGLTSSQTAPTECSSTGVWESELERAVKQIAEMPKH